MQAPPERLGSFYLGAEYDLKTGKTLATPITYDARDLTTHAVCFGMTGSGKTGLCIGLLEEAALDRVPAIIIDPKGDITNLLLQFPELRPDDFLPWINPDDARRKGQTVAEYAGAIADRWRSGLAEWGIAPARIRALQESADFVIYTPGSSAGVPISILGSLAAPHADFDEDVDANRERISGTVAALLELVGVDADPVRSREAVLLATIFEHFWRRGEEVDLTKLILAIQNPPVRKLGVFDVDTFYPETNRFELAMAFNGLIASPRFQSWLRGEALDVEHLLFTAEGKPRHSIFYLAHLSDRERMFFVTLLLENVLTWVRRQTGTTSLRALLYFDEVFGFMPPVAEPPSKRPLITLLKQARAFGLGIVLVTQNPVDIDYKGLTNTGTWFIGKLQAERDKDRVLQGLQGAIAEAGGTSGPVDYDALITQLGSRVFLMHNVHEAHPVVFYTRWVMSYLRGPLTRPQVRRLMAARTEIPPSPVAAAPSPAGSSSTALLTPAIQNFSATSPTLAPSVPQAFLPVTLHRPEISRQLARQFGRAMDVSQARLVYEPAILGGATVHFIDRKRGITASREEILLTAAPERLGSTDWGGAEPAPLRLHELASRPEVTSDQPPLFAPVPERANSVAELRAMRKDLADWLYHHRRFPLRAHKDLNVVQRPDENDREFTIRLLQAARERRDVEVDKLKAKYAKRIDRLDTQLRKLELELASDESEYEARKREEAIGAGESVLSFFLGRRRTSTATSIARRRRMTTRAKMDISETRNDIAERQKALATLEEDLKAAIDEIAQRWEDAPEDVIQEELRPRRTDVKVRLVALAWLPFWLVAYSTEGGPQTTTIPAYPRAAT
jgi:hypothetical protein